MKKVENRVLKGIKKATEIEVDAKIRNKCFLFCYEPKMPKKVKEMQLKKASK